MIQSFVQKCREIFQKHLYPFKLGKGGRFEGFCNHESNVCIYSDLLVHTVTSGGDPVLVDESPPTPVGGGEPEERGATDGHLRESSQRG